MITRLHQNSRMSGVVTYPLTGSMVILSGQVADNKTLDVAGQTADILGKIDRLLADAGVSKADVVSAYVWLTDINTFDDMNSIWDTWVVPGSTPARACVEAALADPALKVEIQVYAYKKS